MVIIASIATGYVTVSVLVLGLCAAAGRKRPTQPALTVVADKAKAA